MTDWPKIIRAVAPNANKAFVSSFAAEADRRFSRHKFTDARAIGILLGQCAHETQGFRKFEENLNYSAKRLTEVWPNRFPTIEFAAQFAGNPEKLANQVYANRMGNGPPSSGDGWRYRGAWMVHHTGRSEYARVEKRTGEPVAGGMTAAQRAPGNAGAMLAGAITYLQDRGIADDAAAGRVDAVSIGINGGKNGLADRRMLCARGIAAMAGQTITTTATTVETRDKEKRRAVVTGTGAGGAAAGGTAGETVPSPMTAENPPSSHTWLPGGAALILGLALAAGLACVAYRAWRRGEAAELAIQRDEVETIEARAAAAPATEG